MADLGTNGGSRLRLDGLKPSRVSDLLADQIFGEIVRNDLAAGTPLPSERELATQLDVGHSTMREALRTLELYGVVSVKPGPRGGVFVARAYRNQLVKTLSLTLQLEKATLDQLLEARGLVEPNCARLAALRAQQGDLEKLRTSVTNMEKSIEDLGDYLCQDVNFHVGMVAAAGNVVLDAFVSSLREIIFGCTSGLLVPVEVRSQTVKTHRKILEAIEARDPERAEQRMKTHLAALKSYLVERLGNLDRRLVPSSGYVISH